MVDKTLNKCVNEAIDLKRQIDALTKEYEAHKDKIKGELTERGISEWETSKARVTFIHFPKKTFDKKAFEKVYPELVKRFTKIGEQARFTIV